VAQPRSWARLSANTQHRYLTRGRRLGMSEAQVIAQYESGANISILRGHPSHHGLSEKRWTQLRTAAKASQLYEDGDIAIILDSLLAKGFSFKWILTKLTEKKESRDTYRAPENREARRRGDKDAGREPGRTRYYGRSQIADIELYYYH
jgi:hypothetical protein